jgi:diacylglycerol kinase family enzyme
MQVAGPPLRKTSGEGTSRQAAGLPLGKSDSLLTIGFKSGEDDNSPVLFTPLLLTILNFHATIITMVNVNLKIFADAVANICLHTILVPERHLYWTIIANPCAGGFSIRQKWKQHAKRLATAVNKAAVNYTRTNANPSATALHRGGESGLIATTGAGHAYELVGAIVDEALPALKPPFHLIIAAGGDGTSREVLMAVADAPEIFRSNCAVLRLPMGTGNDGADAWELDDALALLVAPARIDYTRHLLLTTATAGKGPFPAFNILSVGLDAFVTHHTNKMKGRLPGDSYKLWVDIASLFYDRVYKVGPMEITAYNEVGGLVQSLQQDTLLLAVGVTGHRTYGSHKWILPDDRNVCTLRQMPLLRKVALKEQFNTGIHIQEPEATTFSAHRVEFTGRYPILAQMDGETVLLEPKDFPAAITLTSPVIPCLIKEE